jgi:aspartate carbamoyltransferase regulatory subunit
LKVFPIKSATACVLKWAWSTIYLGQGTTSSCHRVDQHPIDPNNFAQFHNQPEKIAARNLMKQGGWPQAGCQYCEKIEAAGGMSDRMYQLSDSRNMDHIPPELATDPEAVEVTPTILEIYFNNTCNMACVYCGEHFSSKWADENRRYGIFESGRVNFGYPTPTNLNYEQMLSDFWKYLADNDTYKKIRYYQILGGEPFYQKEFDTSLEFWEQHPNPDLTFNIITNLKVAPKKFRAYIDRFERMVESGHMNRLQITGSLDAWGPQEEYVRWGLDLREWEENFTYCLDKPWITLSVNAAITSLTIKTLPELIERINHWEAQRPDQGVHFSFMSATNPYELVPDIFGAGVFEEDFERILATMPTHTDRHRHSREHMQGIMQQITAAPRDSSRIADLITYLSELDRRRGTNWRELFPWLDQTWS